ncbi:MULTISPECIES: methyl-accepting chemotaxis protein [Corallincola]|uniref:Methyl-accepting chemotaxis protein n=3 Tax=Corallincola TaxID=1775176 RepID=A0A368N4T7_9GAMM|nr:MULTISPECIES: methyl-accepting chemotaxis protein [Corallincola]RCU45518.1 methyl-accepting chemotaxis protein [Corallincola holothuriorum]TAA40968.1 methyl-accepting chemotaxis protein [Corallincola spongiicola]TCI02600.1 methyl-accepting chemotaxis protein [Corallincola luteus]
MNSITKKSMVALSAASLVVMLIIFTISYMVARGGIMERLDNNMRDTSEALSVVMQEPVYSYDKDQIKTILETFSKYPFVYQIKAVDQRGKALGDVTQAGDEPAAADIVMQTVNLLWEGKDKIGTLEISYRKDSANEQLTGVLLTYLVIVIVLLIALQITNLMTLRSLVVQPVQQVTDALGEIAAGGGDLTRRLHIDRDDEIGLLANNFDRFIEQLHQLLSSVVHSAEEVSAAANEMTRTVQGTTQATGQQLQETEQVATALNEMSASTHEVAQHANQTAASTRETTALAEEGGGIVGQTIQQIEGLGNDMSETAERISQLRDNSDNIGSMLEVIKSIAEQTNLLALNAAIEAARAGEQGRGFAVVADEVRSLAQRTQQSTQEIEVIIEQLQSAANNAYDAMQLSRTAVDNTIEQSQSAGQSLDQIQFNITSINDMNTQIATAAEEQSSVAEDINRNVTSIHSLSQQVEDDAQLIHRHGEKLLALSSDLKGELGKFSL